MQFFDIHAAVKNLEAAGMDSSMAEAVIKTVIDVNDANKAKFITKDKLALVKEASERKNYELSAENSNLKEDLDWIKKNMVTKSELKAEISELKTEISMIRSELKAEISMARSELKADISGVKAEISNTKVDMIKWIVSLLVAQTGILIAIAKLCL